MITKILHHYGVQWLKLHTSPEIKQTAEIKCSPNVFDNHFLSLTDAILKSADTSTSSDYKIPTSLMKFCKDRISSSDSFKVPLIAVHEVGAYINQLKNKKSNGAWQYQFYDAVESLTYIYNLCIQQNIFPPALKVAKVIPLPKTKDLTDPNQFRFYLFCPNHLQSTFISI